MSTRLNPAQLSELLAKLRAQKISPPLEIKQSTESPEETTELPITPAIPSQRINLNSQNISFDIGILNSSVLLIEHISQSHIMI